MGVYGPLHSGGACRCVAQAVRWPSERTNIHRAMAVLILGRGTMAGRRIGSDSQLFLQRVGRSGCRSALFTASAPFDPIRIDFSPDRFYRTATLVAQLLAGLAR